jgi:hypothetical protein
MDNSSLLGVFCEINTPPELIFRVALSLILARAPAAVVEALVVLVGMGAGPMRAWEELRRLGPIDG